MFDTRIDPDANRGVGVAFTNRLGGVSAGELGTLNLGRTDLDEVESVRANMSRVTRELGVGTVLALNQVHGTQVLVADDDYLRDWRCDSWLGDAVAGQPRLAVADAVVTTAPGLMLAVRVADCLPVVFADPRRRVIGAAHAGRVGLLAGVLNKTLAAMRRLGASDVEAWVGPHICGQCYEVPATMADQIGVSRQHARSVTSWGTPALDLGAACEAELSELGVVVHRRDPCTVEDENLFSHRRQGDHSGRQCGLVWLN